MNKLLLFVLAVGLFTACKKDSTTTETSLDVTLNNVAGNYKITAATAGSGNLSTDIFNNNTFFEACDRDDTYTLTAAGAYTVTDAGLQCSPNNNMTGTYTVNTAAKTITLNGQTGTITSLTNTALVVSQANFMGSGFTVTLTYTRI